MIVKLENLSAEQIAQLDHFVNSRENRATILRWESGMDGYWVETPSDRPLVKVLEGSCRVNPDGYYRVDLEVNERALDPKDPTTNGNEWRRVLATNYLKFIAALRVFAPEPQFDDMRHARGRIDPHLYMLDAPLPVFARPKPKGGTGEPVAVADAETPAMSS